jgi:CRISPR-associated endonuclease/helicase Cas3
VRSLIQLAGRIRRHRDGPCTLPNILLFDTNLRHFQDPGKPAFCRPGFESAEFSLKTHSMSELLAPSEREIIDARPRIVARPPEQLQPDTRLVDLEHARMCRTMLVQKRQAAPALPGVRQRGSAKAPATPVINATSWWSMPVDGALLTALLQRHQPFRYDSVKRVDLFLKPTEDGEDYVLIRLQDITKGGQRRTAFVEVETSQNERIPESAVQGPGIEPWGKTSYLLALEELAQELDMPLSDCGRRFGTVTLPESTNGWRFHPALGFTKRHL